MPGSHRAFCSSLARPVKYGSTMSLCNVKPLPLPMTPGVADLLGHDRPEAEVVGATAAVLLVDGDAEEAVLAGLEPDAARRDLVALPLLVVRHDLVVEPAAERRAELLVLVGVDGARDRLHAVHCTDRSGQPAGQPLLGGQHRLEQVAELVDPVEHIARSRSAGRSTASAPASTSSQVIGVLTHGRTRARIEYTPIVVLWRAFWLQSTKIFPGRTALAIVVVTRSGCCFSSTWPDGQREVGGGLVRARRVQRHVQLQALRARRLGPASRPTAASTSRASSAIWQHSTIVAGAPGRSRTPSPAGCLEVVGAAPSARAARARPCWPTTPAPPARRTGSSRCRRRDRPGPSAVADPLGPVLRAPLLEEALLVGAVGEPHAA